MLAIGIPFRDVLVAGVAVGLLLLFFGAIGFIGFGLWFGSESNTSGCKPMLVCFAAMVIGLVMCVSSGFLSIVGH
jgi:hypothetical protein